jgi:ferredoxin-NADP reductase/nitrite reductase/ring-hydroxylating ferredoxin subunit
MPSTEDYQKVANKKDLKEGGLLRVEPNGTPIALAMVGGKVYAIDAVCTHEGGPLDEGKLEGHNLTCPWHYAVFDVRNGNVSDQTVWATDLQSYAVRVDDSTGDILVSLKTKTRGERGGAVAREEKEGKTMMITTRQQEDERNNSNKESDSDSSQKKYYEEEERKAKNKVTLELLSREKLQDTDIVTFKLSRGGLDFTAGQYAFFKLDGVDSHDSKGPIRHFSIASSPTEQDYMMISTRIRDTQYKQKLASLKEGEKILAWGPQGEFVLHDDHSKPAVFLSGGIGVTPFRSMIKYATDKHLQLKITMFDSNKNSQNILYKDEFDKWASENKNIKVVYTLTEEQKQEQESKSSKWTSVEHGRIDKSMLESHLTRDDIDKAIFYICGPPGMLKSMQELLREKLQIPRQRLRVESFTGY